MSIKHLIRQSFLDFLKKHPAICLDALRQNGHDAIVLDYPFKSVQRYGHGNPPHRLLYDIINNNRDYYKNSLERLIYYKCFFEDIPTQFQGVSESPYWNNPWFPALDAMSLYYFLCRYNPQRYMEIGSGHSTKFARKAISDNGLKTKITSIDPHPRDDINKLCDSIIRNKLEEIDLAIFDEMEEYDVIFIDGSHQCFMNSDVTVSFMEILPQLKSNILVHFHDIFLPYDYPPGWEARFYSEQYLLGSCILFNPERLKIIMPNYFILNDSRLSEILLPIFEKLGIKLTEQCGGSFWIMTQ